MMPCCVCNESPQQPEVSISNHIDFIEAVALRLVKGLPIDDNHCVCARSREKPGLFLRLNFVNGFVPSYCEMP